MHDEHPHRRSLESLRKEAKRWLAALRYGAANARARLEHILATIPDNPTLRDVQHALAREQGFAGWSALKERVAADANVSAGTLAQYADKADALLAAYDTGTPAAMERHWSLTWHRRPWTGMRTYVQLDLGKRPGDDVTITIDDARHFIAREHGFENWNALRKHTATMPTGKPTASKPVRIATGDTEENEQTIGRTRDWDAAVRLLAEHPGAWLDAEGQVTDALLGDIVRVEHLTTLRLGGSKALTDDGLRHLARLPRLRHLDLSGTGITDRGLEVLRELPELETTNFPSSKRGRAMRRGWI